MSPDVSTLAPSMAPDPTVDEQPLPIVGIGASAGGLAAFEAFFSGMPTGAEPGMAFVLVQHLAPDHESILSQLIQRYTRMRVFEVEDGMRVQANCAYIIPPDRDMALVDGRLQLFTPVAPRGHRLAIDFFFRSLADDQHERAIGIVLSGTGSDGTLGVRSIKGEGGMVMAQSPDSTEYDGMPQSAIRTGLVDYQLPPSEMPARLIAYVARALGAPSRAGPLATDALENARRKIFFLLRAQTGHDFSLYKPNTMHRRIERRMVVHQIDAMHEYVEYLQRTPAELDALFRDLLIGVTSFFRDPEAFQTLQNELLPALLARQVPGQPLRIWSAGCSTGEEAYSFAMLLADHQEASKRAVDAQIFATDIDARAIATARAGIYPASIGSDVSAERLARHFVASPDGSTYTVRKSVRDMLVFSEQDVIRDPPFSRVDLISCRNLLIYMGSDLQKRLIPLFHYALRSGGALFLGNSETVGEYADLFDTVDRKSKLYRRKEALHPPRRADWVTPARAPAVASNRPAQGGPGSADEPSLRQLTERALLEHAAIFGVLVNARGDIAYIHGRSGLYLEPPAGEAGVSNVLAMAREGLRQDLLTSLHRAAASRSPVACAGLRVKTNGDRTTVNLSVRPVTMDAESPGEPLFLVVLEPAPLEEPAVPPRATPAETGDPATDARFAQLQRELRCKEEYLQSTNEELEASNEELRSSNEEMQSINEEMQSTNEELETSKEELQSVNEELATVNSELQTKIADLSRTNSDMNNLLAGTGIATIFVDHDLCLLRFTPAATRLINVIPTDVGRPLAHIVSNLGGYDCLIDDTRVVLDTSIPRETEVQTNDGTWHALRIHPYRTLDDVIEGAVITFMDITALKRVESSLRQAKAFADSIVSTVRESLLVLDAELRVVRANAAFCRTFQIPEAEALRRVVFDLGDGCWAIPRLRELLGQVLPLQKSFEGCRVTHDFGPAGTRTVLLDGCRLDDESDGEPLILLAIDDVTTQT